MSQRLGFPNRRSEFQRLQGVGTPILGRIPLSTIVTEQDLTSTMGHVAGDSKTDLIQYLDQIAMQVIPDVDTVSLSHAVTLRLTNGTASKDLIFLCPQDYAAATLAPVTRQYKLRPGGRIAIAPGYKLTAFATTNDVTGNPIVTGAVTSIQQASKLGLPIAKDISAVVAAGGTGTTVRLTSGPITTTNTHAGQLVRLVRRADGTVPATAVTENQVRRIVSSTSNSVTAAGFDTIVLDAAFSTDPAASDVVEIMLGDFWISSARVVDTTRATLIGGVPQTTSGPGMCVRVEGWYFTGLNDNTAASTANARLMFTDRTFENTGTSAAGNAERTVQRFWLTKGITAIVDPAGNVQGRCFTQQALDDCEITGPPGYGLSIVGSSTDITSSAAIVVWGRYVNADQHNQYQPHGVSSCTLAAFGTESVISQRVNEKGTASAGAAGSITDGTKSWATGFYVGAYVNILSGTGAGQTRLITASTGTVLTVTPNWATTPDATSVYMISGFGGDRWWWCYDRTTVAAGDVQGYFASDVGLLSTQDTPLEFDCEIEGLVVNGEGNGDQQLARVFNGLGASGSALNVMPTLLTFAGSSDASTYFSMENIGVRFTPMSGGTGTGNVQTGLGVGAIGSHDSLCVLMWGRRRPRFADKLNGNIGKRNTVPTIQGATS